jgi:hypothetical protein
MRGGGDEDCRLLVNEALAEKACDGRIQALLVVVELHRMVLMSVGHYGRGF